MFQSIPKDVLVFMAIALLAAAVLAIRKTKGSDYRDITIAMPDVLRTNLLYGYYCALLGQYEQTKDHINLFWHSNFFGVDEFVKILKETDCKIVIDLAAFITIKERALNTAVGPLDDPIVLENPPTKKWVIDSKLVLHPFAAEHLRHYFNKLKTEGVLNKITFLYPADEPEFSVKDEAEFKKMVDVSKSVAAEFEELDDALFAIIHGAGRKFWCMPDFAVHGVDDYGQKSQVLTIGEHARLVAALLPGQKTFLVPGCAFGQVPAAFHAYAHANPDEVIGIIPFLWFDDPDHKDVNYTGLVARPEEFKKLWIDTGKSCIAR